VELKSIQDLDKLPSVIESDKLNQYLIQLIDLIDNNSDITDIKGAELINDLIAYQSKNHIGIGNKASQIILDWIKKNYNPDSQKAIEYNTENLAYLNCDGVIEFIQKRLESPNSEFEKYELEDTLEKFKTYKKLPKINEEQVDIVVERVNSFFKKQLEQEKYNDLFCAIKNSIVEHNLCYSISWCLDHEKNLSPLKRAKIIGGGPIMISKISDDIEMAGSAPITNWIEDFEYKIQGLERYWCLQIKYDKKQISSIKSLLNCSTPELLKKINKESNILIEGEDYKLKRLKELLDKANIYNKLEYRSRKKKPLKKAAYQQTIINY
jgi:hypothetical protein